ncbi:hypothetical protein CMI42_03905 [Candidatus Pacearchaeota archaeon]|nr:hypothetical protein [Candidatus Pacearchaeota archaeon]|tara:strand:+ start:68 stop:328 length:261 start_codon:yes stop_codon:yes gene_type:complete
MVKNKTKRILSKSEIENEKKSNKIFKDFIKKLRKEKIPCELNGIIFKKDRTPRFLEAIIKRNVRYSDPQIIKRVPEKYKGVRVKVF